MSLRYVSLWTIGAWVFILALATALSAQAQDAQSPATSSEVQQQQPEGVIKNEEQTETKIAGVYGGLGSVVEFTAEQVGEGDGQTSELATEAAGVAPTDADAIESTIEVNGKSIEVIEDLNGGTVTLDPNNQAFTQQDKQALLGFARELEEKLAPKLEEVREEARARTAEATPIRSL